MSMPVFNRRPRESRGANGLLTLGALLVATGCGDAPDPLRIDPDSRPQNLLLVLVDTLRQDHLPCYGYQRNVAPTLCSLAQEGALLDGRSSTSWTKPATASLLTGLHPLRHQAIARGDRLPEAATTLAERLAESGHHTLGVSANGWVHEQFGFAQGFEELVSVASRGKDKPADGAEVNAAVLARIDSFSAPFFLYVHYVDPHDPYDPPIAWNGDPLSPQLAARAPLRAQAVAEVGFGRRDREQLQDAIDLYDGEIRSLDGHLADLLRLLADRGLLERTLIVVTADHGEEFLDHGRAGHGHSLYPELTRIPMIFHAPGVIAEGRKGGAAWLVDVLPTVLELLGVAPGGSAEGVELDGISRAARLIASQGEPSPRELAATSQASQSSVSEATVSESTQEQLLHLDVDGRAALALQSDGFELMLSIEPYHKQLFDLRLDPDQQTDLYSQPEHRERATALGEGLARRFNRLASRALPRDIAREVRTIELLAALGYLDSPDSQQPDRVLPEKIRPPDPAIGGLLGWERRSQLVACIESTVDLALTQQFLLGWHRAEPRYGGRWTEGRATLVLANPSSPPQQSAILEVAGTNYRPTAVELTVGVGQRSIAKDELTSGPWRIVAEIEDSDLDTSEVLLRLDSEPVFVPASVGRADSRRLGVFVQSVCLKSSRTRAKTANEG